MAVFEIITSKTLQLQTVAKTFDKFQFGSPVWQICQRNLKGSWFSKCWQTFGESLVSVHQGWQRLINVVKFVVQKFVKFGVKIQAKR